MLTSMVKHVENAVFQSIQDLLAGRWQGGIRELGLKEDGVGWVYDDHNQALIPERVKAQVDSLKAEIVAGKIVVPYK
jgi:basic membrane protein A